MKNICLGLNVNKITIRCICEEININTSRLPISIHVRLIYKDLLLFFHYSNQDIPQRKEYVKMVDDTRAAGGEARIFSSMHVSGERKYFEDTSVF